MRSPRVFLEVNKTLVPGNIFANREIVAIYTDSNQQKFVRSFNGDEDDAFVENLGKILKIDSVQN